MFSEGDVVTDSVQDDTPKILKDCLQQLEQYFKGERHEFTFPYTFEGTDFSKNSLERLDKEYPAPKRCPIKILLFQLAMKKPSGQ